MRNMGEFTTPTLGETVDVYWPEFAQYYRGEVTRVKAGGKARVLYDDEDVEWVCFRGVRWRRVGEAAAKSAPVEGLGNRQDDEEEDDDDEKRTHPMENARKSMEAAGRVLTAVERRMKALEKQVVREAEEKRGSAWKGEVVKNLSNVTSTMGENTWVASKGYTSLLHKVGSTDGEWEVGAAGAERTNAVMLDVGNKAETVSVRGPERQPPADTAAASMKRPRYTVAVRGGFRGRIVARRSPIAPITDGKVAEGPRVARDIIARLATVALCDATWRSWPPPPRRDSERYSTWVSAASTECLQRVTNRIDTLATTAAALAVPCDLSYDWFWELQHPRDDSDILRRVRGNYSSWSPPPDDEAWLAEACVLRSISYQYSRAKSAGERESGAPEIQLAAWIVRAALTLGE